MELPLSSDVYTPCMRPGTWVFVRIAIVGVASLLLHGALVGTSVLGAPLPLGRRPDGLSSRGMRRALGGDPRAAREQALEQRKQLVERARAELRTGKLALGRFLLDANAIDAAQERAPFDRLATEVRYEAQLQALTTALRHGPPAAAIAEAFQDLSYAGLPGGRMGDVLLHRTGSCEPIAHLIVAALYDVGRGSLARFRYYGGPLGGVTHLAPVLVTASDEVDLMTGEPPAPGGTIFAPQDIVEVYARSHGLSPALPKARANPNDEGWLAGATAPTRTMSSGYPPNDDVFEGALPMYAERAIRVADRSGTGHSLTGEPSQEGALSPEVELGMCSYVVRFAALDPPRVTILLDEGAIAADVHKAPLPTALERLSSHVVAVEQVARRVTGDPVDETHAAACLAALYGKASLDFTLAGRNDVAARATMESQRAVQRGEAGLARIGTEPEAVRLAVERFRVRHGGHNWMLSFVPGADDWLRRILESCGNADVACDTDMAGAVVSPRLRGWAVKTVSSWPVSDQVDVMHELSRAHDHARPWRSEWRLELGSDQDLHLNSFARAYRVFRPMGWRLWEGDRPIEEAVNGLVADSKREGLDDRMRDALVEYYVRNLLGLYVPRGRGRETVARLTEALTGRGLGELDVVRRRLLPLGRLEVVDGAALAAAFRR